MNMNLGVVPGLLGNTKNTKDSTSNKQPKEKIDWGARDMEAINKGIKSGLTDKQRDSTAKTFNHEEWLAHIDKVGYQLVPKKKQ